MSKKNSPTINLENKIVELTIDSLSYNGGRGVGRADGIVVFVPGTAPGDRIRARITVQKPRFLEAELVEILEPSPSRRKPPCRVADRCGGCSWQHVEYATQVEQKKKILKDALRGVERHASFEWLPFLEAPSEFGYRNRIQVQTRGSDYGFFRKGSHDLVSVRECLIAEPSINEELKRLRLTGDPKIEIARDTSGETRVMAGGRDPEAALFSQVNEAQNEALKKEMLEWIEVKPDWIMDLYAGSGNLTFPLIDRFPGVPVMAVELSRSAVERALNTRTKRELIWQVGDVGQVLAQTQAKKGGVGLVVLDPPRSGATPLAMNQLLRHRPQQIVYVSCNPTTFARDVEILIKSGRYRLEKVRGLDMFPQTEHVELIASLRTVP